MSNIQRSTSWNRRSIGKIALISLVCVVVIWRAVLFFDVDVRRRAYQRGHREARTWNALISLAIEVCYATYISGEQPPTEIDSLMAFVFRHHPQMREGHEYTKQWLDPNTNSVVDQWHNPVNLIVESSHNYKLISPGPNGEDEEGEGDDIIYEFDPWVWFREPNERQ